MKKSKISNIILIASFLVGLSLLLYPTVSDYWNSFHQSRAAVSYERQVAQLDNSEYEAILESAHQYNATLLNKKNRFMMSGEEKKEYESQLKVADSQIMGSIEIPSIACDLPIYHGTDDAVLQIAVGHIEGSSLPVGGKGTHCVLSGHRGLPSAKLFTNLDQLVVGDIFLIHVMDETIAYEVDQIRIVLPEELDNLEIDPEKDYCTLVTCTPYKINTHRLLIRGVRTDNPEGIGSGHVQANAVQLEPLWIALMIAIPMLIALLILILVKDRRRK